jgi:hypothetical protein
MTSAELAEFVAKTRRLFRGEMDEDIFSLAKVRIAGLKIEKCLTALDNYALDYGGVRGRFIAAKFFEYYTKITIDDQANAESGNRITSILKRAQSLQDETREVNAEWDAIRREVDQADPTEVSNALDLLHSAGWIYPPPDRSRWRKSHLLAVSDIVARRARPNLRGELVGAIERYSHQAPPTKDGTI